MIYFRVELSDVIAQMPKLANCFDKKKLKFFMSRSQNNINNILCQIRNLNKRIEDREELPLVHKHHQVYKDCINKHRLTYLTRLLNTHQCHYFMLMMQIRLVITGNEMDTCEIWVMY